MQVSWIFDVISPYSYLGLRQLKQLPPGITLRPVPVLFAGLLNHHGQVGNAEIASKRRFTYRFVVWRARKLDIPFRMPPTHPFNPLSALRLIIAAGEDLRAAETAFDFVFRQGRDVSDPRVLVELASALGLKDIETAVNDPNVKRKLRENTDWAIERGVFGVPTFVAGDELFWGHDSFEMLVDYLRDPALFQDAEMQRADGLPLGVVRTPKESGKK